MTNRKDREKCNLLSNIPVNLDKQEIQRQRNEITENHIDSSVKELMKVFLFIILVLVSNRNFFQNCVFSTKI